MIAYETKIKLASHQLSNRRSKKMIDSTPLSFNLRHV
uniref:UBF9 n=1 Tax=Arundo donax TaxID=35708 RepID=A0A0A9G0X4_ARUDO